MVKADVADERQMSGLWEDLDRNHPPVRGIIHAAGVLTPRGLVDLRAEEFHEVLRSKVTGAWLLHQFAEARKGAGAELDFFVLFSSGGIGVGRTRPGPLCGGESFSGRVGSITGPRSGFRR